MALWYECGNGPARTTFARKDLGADAYLVCPGPSLKSVNPATLKGKGRIVMAVNTAYPYVSPDYWVGMDLPACYDRRLWWEPFVKIARAPFVGEHCEGQPIKECPQTYFVDIEEGDILDIFHRRAHDIHAVWNKNTLHVALHLLVWMGAKRIHLVGCDFGGKSDYHDDRKLSDAAHRRNRRLYGNLCNDFKRLVPEGKRRGVEFISCTPDSPVNQYMPYLPLEDALRQSESRVPLSGGRICDVSELREVPAWAQTTMRDSVMTFVFDKQEWMANWWWENYTRAGNKYPVQWACFDTSAKMEQWCSERGTVIKARCPEHVTSWFRKPFAMLCTKSERTVFIELDVEVRADVGPLLDMADDGLALGRDWSYPYRLQQRMPAGCAIYNTGVIPYKSGDKRITEWAQNCTSRDPSIRGDMEVLSLQLHKAQQPVTEIQKALNHSRQEGEGLNAICVHWAGPGPKNGIRRVVAAGHSDMSKAYHCDWAHRTPKQWRGVVVACDEKQEWILPWWVQKYVMYNRYPVHFVDFGLSEKGKEFCRRHGTLSPVRVPPTEKGLYGFFYKPLALLETPFAQTIWMDTDCEVRGSLAPLWKFADNGGIGVTVDRCTGQKYRDAMPKNCIYNSGVVVYNHGAGVVQEWAGMTMCIHSNGPGDMASGQPGDQDVLMLALCGCDVTPNEIPQSMMRLRIEGDAPCRVMHWTGCKGKRIIQRQMASEGDKHLTSYTPVLAACLNQLKGAVLECGADYWSTELLDVAARDRLVLTLEDNPAWLDHFQGHLNQRHAIVPVKDWLHLNGEIPKGVHFDIALVDNWNQDHAKRLDTIRQIRALSKVLILHDSDSPKMQPGLNALLKTFKYHFTDTHDPTHTTVMSDEVDLARIGAETAKRGGRYG